MEDVKDKMKGLIKKLTPSPSSKFKGHGHVLGSSSPANPTNSRLLTPSAKPNPNPNSPNPEPVATFSCPICSSLFPSEAEFSSHVDFCLPRSGPVSEPASGPVSTYVSGEPKEESVEIVMRLLRNVVRDPGNEKFRRIRMGNPKIKEAVADAEGGVSLLESVGFRVSEEEGEVWATMEMPTEGMIAGIKEAAMKLERWKEERGSRGWEKEKEKEKGADAMIETRPNAVTETKLVDRQVYS